MVTGNPYIVWQQQMEKACIKIFKVLHIDGPDRHYQTVYTKDFEIQNRPLQAVEE